MNNLHVLNLFIQLCDLKTKAQNELLTTENNLHAFNLVIQLRDPKTKAQNEL